MSNVTPVIYLDTSDYIDLSREHLSLDDQVLRQFLIDKVDKGQIIISYSYPILFEFLQKAGSEHREEQLKNADFITELCRGYAQPYPTDLLNGDRLSLNGCWMPKSMLSAISAKHITANLNKHFEKRLQENCGLNRANRRKIRATSDIAKLISQPNVHLDKNDFPGIPVSEEFLKDRVIQRYYAGQLPQHEVDKQIQRWMFEPKYFYQLWYEYANLENPFLEIKKKYDETKLSLSKLHIAIASYERQRAIAICARKEFDRTLRESDLPTSAKSAMKLPELDLQAFTLEFDYKEVAGEFAAKYFNAYFSEVAHGRMAMKKSSDFVDLMHFLYLEHVDLFRCDVRMANLMKRSPATDNPKIVSKRSDLIQRIEHLIQ